MGAELQEVLVKYSICNLFPTYFIFFILNGSSVHSSIESAGCIGEMTIDIGFITLQVLATKYGKSNCCTVDRAHRAIL